MKLMFLFLFSDAFSDTEIQKEELYFSSPEFMEFMQTIGFFLTSVVHLVHYSAWNVWVHHNHIWNLLLRNY